MSNGYMNMSDEEFITHVRSMMFKEPLTNAIVEQLLIRLEYSRPEGISYQEGYDDGYREGCQSNL